MHAPWLEQAGRHGQLLRVRMSSRDHLRAESTVIPALERRQYSCRRPPSITRHGVGGLSRHFGHLSSASVQRGRCRRPPVVADRQTYGHWEADLMQFGRSESRMALVLQERHSRLMMAVRSVYRRT